VKNGGLLLVFVGTALAQMLVPAGMIARRESTLRHGRAYKFRTAPIDPYDAFRGRFVWLGYDQHEARWNGQTEVVPRSRAYGLVEEGRDGFAVVREVAPQPPRSGDYVQVEQVYRGWGTNSGVVNFRLPFDRYYMEETKAPTAEQAYREHSNRRGQTNHNTYAVVRIKDGDAVMEDLCVDGVGIAKFVRQQTK
jgi:uncharacterized membrane-anchored protein